MNTLYKLKPIILGSILWGLSTVTLAQASEPVWAMSTLNVSISGPQGFHATASQVSGLQHSSAQPLYRKSLFSSDFGSIKMPPSPIPSNITIYQVVCLAGCNLNQPLQGQWQIHVLNQSGHGEITWRFTGRMYNLQGLSNSEGTISANSFSLIVQSDIRIDHL